MSGWFRSNANGFNIHLLFERHAIIQAYGARTESFQPADRTLANMAAAPRAEIAALFPELGAGVACSSAARVPLKSCAALALLRI